MNSAITAELVESRIYIIRGHKIMLSTVLAELYEVEARTLVQEIRRNPENFPRRMIAGDKDLARRLSELEKKYDAQFRAVFDAIRRLKGDLTRCARGKRRRPAGVYRGRANRSLSGSFPRRLSCGFH